MDLETLKGIYLEPMDNDWTGWIVIILTWIASLIIIGLIGYGILWLIDTSFRPKYEGYMYVNGKHFVPAHTTTTYIYQPALKMHMPSTIHHPDNWYISIQLGERTASFDVTQQDYNKIKTGQQLWCKYYLGRIWKTVYIKQIDL